jgi:hypothetical protein
MTSSLVLLTTRATIPGNPPPCRRENPQLWFSDLPEDFQLAKAYCRPCPIRRVCLAGARYSQLAIVLSTRRQNGILKRCGRHRCRPGRTFSGALPVRPFNQALMGLFAQHSGFDWKTSACC